MEEDKHDLATQIRHLIGLAAKIHKTSQSRFEKAHKLMDILKCFHFLTTCRQSNEREYFPAASFIRALCTQTISLHIRYNPISTIM